MHSFSAMRGKMGDYEYFQIMAPIPEMTNMFEGYVNQRMHKALTKAGLDLKTDIQRNVDPRRIPNIVQYLNDNPENWVFASIVASFSCDDSEYEFEEYEKFPFRNGIQLGKLTFHTSERFLINDGQHRASALIHALQDPSFRRNHEKQHISIMLFRADSLARQRQIFHDLNSQGKPVTGALLAAIGHTPIALITQEIAEELEIFSG